MLQYQELDLDSPQSHRRDLRQFRNPNSQSKFFLNRRFGDTINPNEDQEIFYIHNFMRIPFGDFIVDMRVSINPDEISQQDNTILNLGPDPIYRYTGPIKLNTGKEVPALSGNTGTRWLPIDQQNSISGEHYRIDVELHDPDVYTVLFVPNEGFPGPGVRFPNQKRRLYSIYYPCIDQWTMRNPFTLLGERPHDIVFPNRPDDNTQETYLKIRDYDPLLSRNVGPGNPTFLPYFEHIPQIQGAICRRDTGPGFDHYQWWHPSYITPDGSIIYHRCDVNEF